MDALGVVVGFEFIRLSAGWLAFSIMQKFAGRAVRAQIVPIGRSTNGWGNRRAGIDLISSISARAGWPATGENGTTDRDRY